MAVDVAQQGWRKPQYVGVVPNQNLHALRNKDYVIICPEEARALIKVSTEREMPKLVVLSIPEIDKEIKLESLGEVKVG